MKRLKNLKNYLEIKMKSGQTNIYHGPTSGPLKQDAPVKARKYDNGKGDRGCLVFDRS